MVLEEEKDFKQKKEKDKFPKKIVVRKLPPTFTKEDFLNSVEPLADYNYFSFITADRSLGVHAYSRAYINFTSQEDVFIFRDQFDGYVFVDQKGNEYPAIVEYAPFPKIPKQTKQRVDPRCGTIDNDEDYLAFLELLKEEANSAVPQIEAMLEEIEKEEKLRKAASGTKIKTPLLEFVEQRASDRQKMIEKRRRKEIDKRKSREDERKKRKEMAKKREEVYKEEREKFRQKREQKEKSRKNIEYDRETRVEYSMKESKSGDVDRRAERGYAKNIKGTESVPLKSKRYSEVRKREEREKRYKTEAPTESSTDNIVCKSLKSNNIEKPPEPPKSSRDLDVDRSSNADDTNDKIESKEENTELLEDENLKLIEEAKENSPDRTEMAKDARSERRIRNKDRPDMQLYRPGQSRMKTSAKTSRERNENGSSSSSSSPLQDIANSITETDNLIPIKNHRDESKERNSQAKEELSNTDSQNHSYYQDDKKKCQSKSKEDASQFKKKTFRRTD